jgi:hypothetical protein
MRNNRKQDFAGISALVVVLACTGALLAGGEAQAQDRPERPENPTATPAPADGLSGSTPAVETATPVAAPADTEEGSAEGGSEEAHETNCDDGKDDDDDSMTDCGDADCKAAPNCQPGQDPENSNERCSDWVDNDGDGSVDCDDADCEGPGVTICKGSWKGSHDGTGTGRGAGNATDGDDEAPELRDGMSVEDLLGKGDDKDGERNDQVCSDGVDNDKDGRIDCADLGCRFDPSVTVCRGNPGMRFSVVAGIAQEYNIKNYRDGDGTMDTRFSRIQLRSFGPIPLLQDSFYLLSLRAEKSPRLTFAMFQLPIGTGGHYVNINSGGGGLSSSLILSTSKQLLLDPAYFVYSAFEQGNGASFELGGPLLDGRLGYRVFIAGGSGRSSGNVGGRYFTYDNNNYTYTAGGQMMVNIIGIASRFDSPFLYTTVPTTVGLAIGGKYDQRAQERYPATNVSLVARSGRFVLLAENYSKWELEFESFQTAYVVQVGFLAIPKRLLLAADYGAYIAGEMKNPPAVLQTDLRRQLDEVQWRVAAHVYLVRNIGLLSLLYTNRAIANADKALDANVEQTVRLEAQYRF